MIFLKGKKIYSDSEILIKEAIAKLNRLKKLNEDLSFDNESKSHQISCFQERSNAIDRCIIDIKKDKFQK